MIEKMVLFENQKQLEETRDELERCKRFSFRLYAKELPLELTLSHEENNEVNAVKAILKDMEKGNWPMLHYFRMHCKSDSNPPKILQANAIGCVMMSLRYLTARNISASEFKKKIFDWDEDGEGYETYQRRVRALASKTKKVEQIKMNHTEEFPFNLVCPYQFIPTMKKNEKVKEFLTPLFSAATKHIVEENRDSVSWNVLRLAEKEKEIFDESDTGSLEKQKKSRLKDRCEDLCVAIEKMSKVDLSQKGNHSETVVLYFARENIYHCEKLNRIGKEKIDQRTARLIIHKSCYPMAFYLDEIIEKIRQADGFIPAAPVYFGTARGDIMAALQRIGKVSRGNDKFLEWMVGGPIAVARRGGQTLTLQEMTMFFPINNMIVAGSTYWNMVFAGPEGTALDDSEGIATIKLFGQNVANIIKKLVD